jgi:hypothetical protein
LPTRLIPEAANESESLDVDVQCEEQFDPGDPGVWECFERLRGLKNAAFFESITEVAAVLYE